MKKIFIVIFILLTLTSCWCKTKECLDYQLEQQKIAQEQVEKDRTYQLEAMKIQAQIEANKPVEVKVQELKNQQTTVGDWIQTAVWVAWWAYLLWKVLNSF